jgi:hypothetical protein
MGSRCRKKNPSYPSSLILIRRNGQLLDDPLQRRDIGHFWQIAFASTQRDVATANANSWRS